MMSTSAGNSQPLVTRDDLEAILDSLAEGVVTMDDQGRILLINRAACELLGVQEHEALRADCCELMAKRWCDVPSAVRDSIRGQRPSGDVQVEVQSRSGSTKTLMVRTRALRASGEEPQRAVLILHDVTDVATRTVRHASGGRSGGPGGQAGLGRPLEAAAIRDMLKATGWNVAKAARRLGVSRATLYKRLAKLGIERPDE